MCINFDSQPVCLIMKDVEFNERNPANIARDFISPPFSTLIRVALRPVSDLYSLFIASHLAASLFLCDADKCCYSSN